MKHFLCVVSQSIFALAFLGLGPIAAIAEGDDTVQFNPPDRWIEADTEKLGAINRQLKTLMMDGLYYDPVGLTHRLFGPTNEEATAPENLDLVIIQSDTIATPDADFWVVNYIQEGFRDDSVKGIWYQVVYEKPLGDQVGPFAINALNQAYLCRRGKIQIVIMGVMSVEVVFIVVGLGHVPRIELTHKP
ncbi:MAG: hypothetical protein HC796_09875, partial [Synechococcaceae cyanobacterium RL_1_2]|nr:hypothetical protein [Synechococcaceae cyanobacterium RL_1_2]